MKKLIALATLTAVASLGFVLLSGGGQVAEAAIVKGVVTWTDNSTNETAFLISRKLGPGGTYAQVGTVGANVATFTDDNGGAGLALNTNYCYSVVATNAGLNSAATADVCAVTPNSPAAPSGVTVNYIIQ